MHVMIDLETLGTSPRAVILSIGAVAFETDGTFTGTYYTELFAQEQIDVYSRYVSIDTIAWWGEQSPEAKSVLTSTNAVSLHSALDRLRGFLPEKTWEKAQVWSNGASFDIPMLNDAYQGLGEKAPWRYWNERCYRTMKNYFAHIKSPAPPKVAHNALEDAKAQAAHLALILQSLEKNSGRQRA